MSERSDTARSKIIYYMLNHPMTSKAELAKELQLSMPTVLTNVNALIAQNLVTELGEYSSTEEERRRESGSTKAIAGQ